MSAEYMEGLIILVIIVVIVVSVNILRKQRASGEKNLSSRAKNILSHELIAVGDICDPKHPHHARAVGDLIQTLVAARQQAGGPPTAVAVLGDLAYPNGSAKDFRLFNQAWPWAAAAYKQGALWPVPGNHEYREMASTRHEGLCSDEAGEAVMVAPGNRKVNPSDLAYFRQFPTGSSYYTRKLGNWRVIMLDDSCWALPDKTTIPNSVLDRLFAHMRDVQTEWLKVQLAAAQSAGEYIVGGWHHPHVNSPGMNPIYALFAAHGARLILTGHAHQYSRFTTGVPVPVIVTGTGGAHPSRHALPGADASILGAIGVSRVTLRSDGTFATKFIDTAGRVRDTYDSAAPS
jgi:acid phosphatase type 7